MTSIDLHIHSNFSSDSSIRPDKLIKQALKMKIDVLCITDHNVFDESSAFSYYTDKHKKPLIIKGVELSTNNGDLLIFGLKNNFWKDYIPNINVDAKKVIADVASFNGVAIWAHPFRSYCEYCYNTEYKMFSGVNILEVKNAKNLEAENLKAFNYACNNNFKMTGGSDAHSIEDLGKALTLFKDTITCEEELIEALKNGIYTPISHNEYLNYDLDILFTKHK